MSDPRVPPTSSSIEQEVYDFNKKIFAFEDHCAEEIRHLIALLSRLHETLDLPKSADILTDSLHYIMDAETQEELSVYKDSFLLALQNTKLRDILDIEPCLLRLRLTATDLFYEVGLDIEKNTTQTVIQDILHPAQIAVTQFNEHAQQLLTEFNQQIIENNHEMDTIRNAMHQQAAQVNDAYFSQQEKMAELKELNKRYHAGIKQINTQIDQITHAIDLIEKITASTTQENYLYKQAELASIFQKIRRVDKQNGYHHFANKCKEKIEALCTARSAYLPKDKSWFNLEGKCESMSLTFPRFSRDPILTKEKLILGKRTSDAPPRKSPLTIVSSIVKKALSILISIGSFILSAICFWSPPKAALFASNAINILDTVIQGSDLFTEYSRKIKHANLVINRLNALEKRQENLRDSLLSHPTKKDGTNSAKQPLNSQSKIDLLLMGNRPSNILSKEEIAKIDGPPLTENLPSVKPMMQVSEPPEIVSPKKSSKHL